MHDYCVGWSLVSIRDGHTVISLSGPGRQMALVAFVALLLVGNDIRLLVAVYQPGQPAIALVIAAYALALLSLWVLLLNENRMVRTAMQVLLFAAMYTDILYLILANFPFSYPDAINLFNNPAYASGAVSTFRTAFLLAFAATAILYIPFHRATRKLQIVYKPAWLMLFAAIAGSLWFYSGRHPGIYDIFPSVYRVSGNLLTARRLEPELAWSRETVTEQPVKRRAKHVFVVVDESVTATALSVNNNRLATTPFLQSQSARFINFGTAASFSNYSAGSNIALVSGLQYADLPDRSMRAFKNPGIFRYAQRAGYRAYLLDAQTNDDQLQNYLTQKDLPDINSVIQVRRLFPALPPYARDSAVARQMAAIAASGEPTFTYVNKAGAHWPYNEDFVPGLHVPGVSGIGNSENIADYHRSVYWNVDRFWQLLLARISPADSVLIIYTADHGEDYTSKSFRIKHASIYQTNAVEGQVPMMVFEQSGFFPGGFTPGKKGYSHQEIFPTVLLAMGYDSTFVRSRYGRSLLDPPGGRPLWFQTGDIFGRGANRRMAIDTQPDR